MELIILGKKHDINEEIEIFYDEEKHPFGFDVILTEIEGDIIECHNVTEYHHLWDKSNWQPENVNDRLACESDIHGSGHVPWKIKEVDEMLANETPESMERWLETRRYNANKKRDTDDLIGCHNCAHELRDDVNSPCNFCNDLNLHKKR